MLKKSFSNKLEAGCDEAGRGSLAGPVVGAAVILPKNFKNKKKYSFFFKEQTASSTKIYCSGYKIYEQYIYNY